MDSFRSDADRTVEMKREVQSLERELRELRGRVETLEALLAAKTTIPGSQGSNGRDPSATREDPTEIILVISAAVAAFLGKRASIRQIRLTGETPWAQQGRATIQASHDVEYVRGLR